MTPFPWPTQLRGTDSINLTTVVNTADWGTDHLQRVLVGSRLTFLPDGHCLLVAGPAAAVRDDLYPLPGCWQIDGSTVVVNLSRATDSGIVTQLNGTLSNDPTTSDPPRNNPPRPRLDAVHVTTSPHGERQVSVAQTLIADDTTITPPNGGLDIVQLHAAPLTYAITLSGTDGVRDFTDITTHLVFRPTPAPARGPVRFTLGVGAEDKIGGIVWHSHLDGHPSLTAFDTSITLAESQLSAEYHHGDPASIAVTWLRASLPLLPSAPVVATQAHLDLTFTEQTIQGHVRATGMAPPSPLHYHAHLTGHWITPPETPYPDQ